MSRDVSGFLRSRSSSDRLSRTVSGRSGPGSGPPSFRNEAAGGPRLPRGPLPSEKGSRRSLRFRSQNKEAYTLSKAFVKNPEKSL